ncbi:hypothetical protein TNCV_2724991 [Trichonephila clavipes]|nr:hypothetical protein TNCV_2724991 [Trichonephila clavipes]
MLISNTRTNGDEYHDSEPRQVTRVKLELDSLFEFPHHVKVLTYHIQSKHFAKSKVVANKKKSVIVIFGINHVTVVAYWLFSRISARSGTGTSPDDTENSLSFKGTDAR